MKAGLPTWQNCSDQRQSIARGALWWCLKEYDGVVIPGDYKDKVKEVVERQIVLSGYRICDATADLFGE